MIQCMTIIGDNMRIKLSKTQWEDMGKKAGWVKVSFGGDNISKEEEARDYEWRQRQLLKQRQNEEQKSSLLTSRQIKIQPELTPEQVNALKNTDTSIDWSYLQTPNYSKYINSTPKTGGKYYSLMIPKNITCPKKGDKLKLDLDGNLIKVVVEAVMTPLDMYKGKGAPVARSMEVNGIGWYVTCLPERQ